MGKEASKPVGKVASGACLLAGAVGVAHGLPALATLRRLRSRLTPALAGVGRPDHVALTFDDGPDPASTPRFLDVLAEFDVHATFFVLGGMLARARGLAAETAAAGHEVAVHGWDHRPMLLRGPASTYDQLARTRDLVVEVTGRVPRFVRPPHGILSAGVLVAAHRLGLTPVLWTAWGRDWTASATPATVLETLLPDLRGGATVLLHDSDVTSAPGAWRSALGALPDLVGRCRERGLELGALADHGILPHPAGDPFRGR